MARDPVVDDPSFNLKHWVLNVVDLKPYWPLGTLPTHPCEIIAELFQKNIGTWMPIRRLEAVKYWAPLAVEMCRRRYGMVIEEKLFSGEIHYRWRGAYRGNVDDRLMSEQMRQEERDLLAMRVKLQTENLELFQSYRQLLARFREWSRQIFLPQAGENSSQKTFSA